MKSLTFSLFFLFLTGCGHSPPASEPTPTPSANYTCYGNYSQNGMNYEAAISNATGSLLCAVQTGQPIVGNATAFLSETSTASACGSVTYYAGQAIAVFNGENFALSLPCSGPNGSLGD